MSTTAVGCTESLDSASRQKSQLSQAEGIRSDTDEIGERVADTGEVSWESLTWSRSGSLHGVTEKIYKERCQKIDKESEQLKRFKRGKKTSRESAQGGGS